MESVLPVTSNNASPIRFIIIDLVLLFLNPKHVPYCMLDLLIQDLLTKYNHKKKPAIKLAGFCVVVPRIRGDF